MVTFALDTSAILRYIDSEAGPDRVAEIFLAKTAGTAEVVTSAIHWGEFVGVILKRHGHSAVQVAIERLNAVPVRVIPATAERAARAAAIKFRYVIPYADAFGVELAGDTPDHVLVTADFDVKPAQGAIAIEFLPTKPKT